MKRLAATLMSLPLAACAAALRAAGTRELAAVAFARAPGR